MTHLPTPTFSSLRSLFTLPAAAAFALMSAMGTGCLGEVTDDSELSFYAGLPVVDCSGASEWAQGTTYPAGTLVTDTGDLFSSRVSHTAFGIDWNPKLAGSLWLVVGQCGNGGGGGVDNGGGGGVDNGGGGVDNGGGGVDNGGGGVDNGGGGVDNGGGGVDNGGDNGGAVPDGCSPTGAPGPQFDPAGPKNVGNGAGGQFIFGQCLSNADCGSGCCAGPCGICSGPAVGNVAGKTGCGFPDPSVLLR